MIQLIIPALLLVLGWAVLLILARRNERKVRSDWENLLGGDKAEWYEDTKSGIENNTKLIRMTMKEAKDIKTKPIVMEGKSLHLNMAALQGEIRAEILDAEGKKVLAGFSREECIPVRGDSLKAELKWKKTKVSSLVSKMVRLRFILRNASLYAFWAGN